jgi:outer membrane protein TolC
VAKANFETSKLALDQSKENYEIVKNRFKEGLSDNTDLIDANYLLSAAKQNYYKAYYDKYISIETLNRVLEK